MNFASNKFLILHSSFLIAAFLLLSFAGVLNIRLLEQRQERHLTQAPPTQNMPPLVAFTTVALGGFRGILADVLWMRAGTLQDEGRFFELVQLSDWITKLQPRSPVIWAYHAWNMAYNISTLMTAPDERWRWVRNGLVLLRDEGMVLNPGSARLHQELAWMFLHKLGSGEDPAASHYRARWAAEVEAGAAPLDPALVRRIEKEIAPWTGALRRPTRFTGPWPACRSPAMISMTSPCGASSTSPCCSGSRWASASTSRRPPPACRKRWPATRRFPPCRKSSLACSR